MSVWVWRQPANRAVNRQTVAVRLPPSTVPRFHGSAVSRAATAGLHGSTARRGTVRAHAARTVPRLSRETVEASCDRAFRSSLTSYLFTSSTAQAVAEVLKIGNL